jgi:hypothetical protein
MNEREMSGQLFRKTALERLSSPEELDSLMQVTNPKGWMALLALGGLVLVAVVWGFFGSVPVKATAHGVLKTPDRVRQVVSPTNIKKLEAVLFVSPDEGRTIRPGMKVLVSPQLAGYGEKGAISGVVVRVSTLADGHREILQGLRNQKVIQGLPSDSSPMEIQVDLLMDPATASGYKWSSGHGPSMKLESGTTCSAAVIVDEKPPLAFMLPLFGKSSETGRGNSGGT